MSLGRLIMKNSCLKANRVRLGLIGLLALVGAARPCTSGEAPTSKPAEEPWLHDRLEWFQDQKFGFMMHWAPYSQWGCIESWPLVEEDKWARPDDLKAWTDRGRDLRRFTQDYWGLPQTFNPVNFDPRLWAKAAKADETTKTR